MTRVSARQDRRADRQRPGPRAPADLVDADDDVVAEVPHLPLDGPRRAPASSNRRPTPARRAGDRHRSTTAGAASTDLADRQKPSATRCRRRRVDRGEQPARRLRVVARAPPAVRRRRRLEVPFDVVAVAGVAAGAHAPLGGRQRRRGRRRARRVDHQPHAGALGHLPGVAGEAVAGDVGDGVHGVAERLQRLGRGAVERAHPGDGRRLVVVAAAGEHEAGAERLGQHQHVARSGARLAEDPVGVDEPLHGEPEDRLRVADRVAAGDRAAGLGDDRRGRVEDGGDRARAGSARGRRRR